LSEEENHRQETPFVPTLAIILVSLSISAIVVVVVVAIRRRTAAKNYLEQQTYDGVSEVV